jgi:mannose-6-phosphate isomerase-like protein (cupin superfamily)
VRFINGVFMARVKKVVLREKLRLFKDFWSPRKIGELNDCLVMVAKCKGELPWHHHDGEDEMFLSLKGEFIVRVNGGKRSCASSQASALSFQRE